MGNPIDAFLSGLGNVIGGVLGHPLDFLSGKACNEVCTPTWDFFCYIENFCVSHLLKFVMVAMLVYFVLLFFYLVYNLGICQCICHTFCRVIYACFSTCFSSLIFCCTYLCYKLSSVKRTSRRRRRKRDIENINVTSTTSSSSGDEYELNERPISLKPRRNVEHKRSRFSKRRNYRDEHMRRSLRATNHRRRVEFSGHVHGKRALKNIGDADHLVHHHLRVTKSSRFSRKGGKGRKMIHQKRKVKKKP